MGAFTTHIAQRLPPIYSYYRQFFGNVAKYYGFLKKRVFLSLQVE